MCTKPFGERAVFTGLKSPVLITAFTSQTKGGATAATALAYVVEQLKAEPVLSFDGDTYYDYTRTRPWIQRDGDTTIVHWPDNVVHRVDGKDHSFLFLVGVEPHLNWPDFVERIVAFAQRVGVQTAASLRSIPATLPHTIDAPVRAIYSNPDLKTELGFGEVEDQEGVADIGRLINLRLAGVGCRTVDLYAIEPFYSNGLPDATAALSLLEALRPVIDVDLDFRAIREMAEAQRNAFDKIVASSDKLSETVSALEEQAIAMGFARRDRFMLGLGHDTPGLDSAEVINEVEEMFRDFQGGPGPSLN